MKSLPRNLLFSVAIVLVLLLVVALVEELVSRPAPSTGGVAIQYLGPREVLDPTRSWPTRSWCAFSISNGTSKPFFYYSLGIDYRSPTGWFPATWTGTAGPPLVAIDYLTSSGIVAPSNATTFLAGIPASNIPWRLRVCYREAGLRGSFETSLYRLVSRTNGSPPSTVWSGRPQLLITDEIRP